MKHLILKEPTGESHGVFTFNSLNQQTLPCHCTHGLPKDAKRKMCGCRCKQSGVVIPRIV